MIGAIDPGIGLKDEQPVMPADRRGSPGFNRELDRVASRSTAAAEPRTEVERPDPGDPRARSRYGRATGTAAREDAPGRGAEKDAAGEKVAPDGEPQLAEAARKARAAHLRPADDSAAGAPEGETAEGAVAAAQAASEAKLSLAGLSLARSTGEDGAPLRFPGPGDRPPIQARIGEAAWRLGPHGEGEGESAQQAGRSLPGGTRPAPSTARQLALQEAVLRASAQIPQAEGEALEAQALLRLAEQRDKAVKGDPAQAKLEQQVQANTARARHELLGQLGQSTQQGTSGDPRLFVPHPTHEGLAEQRPGTAEVQQGRQALGELRPGTAAEGTQGALPGGVNAAASVDHSALARSDTGDQAGRELVERVAQEARWLLSNRRNEVTIRLRPEHLGQLHLKVTQHDGTLRVDMTVDSQMAKHMLESNLADLRQRMAEQHPDAGEFQFNVDVRKGHDAPPEFRMASERGEGAERVEGPRDAAEEAAAKGVARRLWGDHSLSIYA